MASIHPVSSGAAAYWPAHTQTAAPSPAAPARGGRFDQVALTSEPEGDSRFRMALVGRLSQEVRATTTTGDIQELRRQVIAREYQPDAGEIAARLLLMKGAQS